MNIKILSDPAIQSFIRDHEKDDTNALALKKPPVADWPYHDILNQIKSRQKAAKKIPEWHGAKGIIWPPPDIIEQASSSATALYKAHLFNEKTLGKTLIDLTGGAGVDTHAFMQNFDTGYCIEQNDTAATLLKNNLKIMTNDRVNVINDTAENYIQTATNADLIYVDPARRTNNQKGKFILKDCSPDILNLLPQIQEKTQHLLIKTSPILDITQTIKDLENVTNIYILEYKSECKEVLYHLDFTKTSKTPPKIHAITLNEQGNTTKAHQFTQNEEKQCAVNYSAPRTYLYEPGPAAMKSGGFKTIGKAFNLCKLHEHTHLYTADTPIKNFPGRSFEVVGTYPANAKKIPINKANLAIRNFPGTVESLKKQLKIKDGGTDFLFACTLQEGEKAILHCRKINPENNR